jgi:RNA-directed DNA polymerase
MKLTALGHVRVKSPETAWARVEASNTERSGRRAPMPRGVLSSKYSEVGKACHKGKDLTEVHSPQSKLAPDIVGLDQSETTSLRGIAKGAQACKDHHFQNLYRTKLVRRCYIPKENGGERPLGIPALEDKLVQSACAKILGAIYEADFLTVSYGYRPGISAKDAVSDLGFNMQYGRFGHVVEADIKGYFDSIDHDWLLQMLSLRIDDKAFLSLIRQWLKAGILDIDGQILHLVTGSPQGGIVLPILANVCLHYAIDLWFERVVKAHCQGQALIIRFADDYVCAFQYRREAERFYRVMSQRLTKFGLKVAPEKSRILRFSRFHPGLRRRIAFLGFELYWARDRRGDVRVMKRTARQKLQMAKRQMKCWLRANRHIPGRQFIKELNRKLVGHYNYFGIRSNGDSVNSFYHHAVGCAFKWLNRRGGKKSSFTWATFKVVLKKLGLAMPRIVERKRQHAVFV